MNKFRILSVLVVLAMIFSFANVSPAGAATTAVTLQEGTATWSQSIGSYLVDQAVDGIILGGTNGWAIHPYQGADQIAVFETSTDISASQLDFALHQAHGDFHTLGRFRLSYTTDDRSTFADGLNSGGNVTANWTVLTGATISSSCACGETFTILPDNSILVGGFSPSTNIYNVSFAGSFVGVTGIRLEALSDASLPSNGPGRQPNGNFVLSEITLDATYPNPLDDAGWELVAHMSNSGGMFDGDGELLPTYSYGTFVPNPVASTPDFQRAFPVVADKILFITGDGSIWAIADYGDLRTLIDARAGVFPPNLAFETGVNGVISNTTGNVLSRLGVNEDPWISMEGDHSYGVFNDWIVWGEINYNGLHVNLKNNHGGINVYVMAADNVPPTANAGGPYLVAVGQQVAFDGSGSSDPDPADTLTESWTASGGTVAGNVYSAGTVPGIYDVQLIVNDGKENSQPATTMVVVYDPSGGFVTGGGWIDSPAGAYKADETLSGKASFGFVAKYKKGATVPDGNTQFQFKAGDLNFHSTSYEWLVVAGNTAQFKGEGTINGQGSYMFKIWADDNNPDTFRIMIWGDSGVVYDNGSQQSLGGGSIKVHQ